MKKEHIVELLKVQVNLSRLLLAFKNLGFDELSERLEILQTVVNILGYDKEKHVLDGLFIDFQCDIVEGNHEDTDDNIKKFTDRLVRYLYDIKPS